MKKGLTEIVFILDKSGSMEGLEADTIGGFNSFVDKQRGVEGEALVSTVLFSSNSTVLHDRVPLTEIRELTAKDYRVYGGTALVDAIGDAVKHISNVHKYIRCEDVPEHTVFVIITDGEENSSCNWTSDQVKELIEERKQKGWEFLFLAANIDAVETAACFGIDSDRAVDYCADAQGTELNFRCVSKAIDAMRTDCCLSGDWMDEIKQDMESRK